MTSSPSPTAAELNRLTVVTDKRTLETLLELLRTADPITTGRDRRDQLQRRAYDSAQWR